MFDQGDDYGNPTLGELAKAAGLTIDELKEGLKILEIDLQELVGQGVCRIDYLRGASDAMTTYWQVAALEGQGTAHRAMRIFMSVCLAARLDEGTTDV